MFAIILSSNFQSELVKLKKMHLANCKDFFSPIETMSPAADHDNKPCKKNTDVQ